MSIFLVGAVKAGTTALYNNLSQHTQLYFSPIKEPHYFSTDIDPSQFREDFKNRVMFNRKRYFGSKELRKLHQAFIDDEEDYHLLFRSARPDQKLADASASYLWSSFAAQNIYNYNPAAKIVILLRNPIERAFSHYLMDKRMNYVSSNFKSLLKDDFESNHNVWGQSSLYYSLGLYAVQVERYLNVFPADQILIIKHEDFKTNLENTEQRIIDFLGLTPSIPLNLDNKFNKGYAFKEPAIGKLLNTRVARTLRGVAFLKGFKSTLLNILTKPSEEVLIEDSERKYACSLFESDIAKLENLLKTDFSSWKC